MSESLRRKDDEIITALREELFEMRTENIKLTTQLSDKLTGVSEDVKAMRKILLGNGTTDRSLVVRFDRLEQDAKRTAKVLWMVCSAVVTAGVAAIAVIIKHVSGK